MRTALPTPTPIRSVAPIIALTIALAIVLAAAPGAAWAHDWVTADGAKVSAGWIMSNPRTSFCCGPEDCEPVPGRVRYTPAGWTVDGLKGAVPMDRTYKSIDGQPWACRHLHNNQIRCLFLPQTRN